MYKNFPHNVSQISNHTKQSEYIYIHIYIYIYIERERERETGETIVEGNPKVVFIEKLRQQGVGEGINPFPGLLHFSLIRTL